MKVLRKGNPDRGKIYHGDCYHCKSEIEAHVDQDKLAVEYDQREGGSFAHVTCPVCGQGMVVYRVKD